MRSALQAVKNGTRKPPLVDKSARRVKKWDEWTPSDIYLTNVVTALVLAKAADHIYGGEDDGAIFVHPSVKVYDD